MPLGKYEDEIWREALKELGGADSEYRPPVHLQVDEVLVSPADLLDAVLVNRARYRLSDVTAQAAMSFVGDVIGVENPEAVIADLPYEEGPKGLEVILTFPHNGGDA